MRRGSVEERPVAVDQYVLSLLFLIILSSLVTDHRCDTVAVNCDVSPDVFCNTYIINMPHIISRKCVKQEVPYEQINTK